MHHHLFSAALLLAACGATMPDQTPDQTPDQPPGMPPVQASAAVPAVPASPAPSVARTTQVAALRYHFNLHPPTGRIERDARGRWLVDDRTGARLVMLPNAACEDAPRTDVWAWRLFRGTDGEPGAALALGRHVTVHTWDPERRCRTSAVVLEPTLPTTGLQTILRTDWLDHREGLARPVRERVDMLGVFPGRSESATFTGPGGQLLTATLTPTKLQILAGSGAAVFEDTLELGAGKCQTRQYARLDVATTVDGTYVHLEVMQEIDMNNPWDPSDDSGETGEHCRSPTVARFEQWFDVWVLIPADGPPLVLRRQVHNAGIVIRKRITIDNGVLMITDVAKQWKYGEWGGMPAIYAWDFTPATGGPPQKLIFLEE